MQNVLKKKGGGWNIALDEILIEFAGPRWCEKAHKNMRR